MATINVQRSSIVNLSTCNNQKSNNIFKTTYKYSTSAKFPYNPSFTQLNHNNYQNALLKPFLKPLITSSTAVKFTSEPLFFGGGGAHTGLFPGSGRADFRAWSRRQPGSKSKDKRLIIDLECNGCLKHRYTTERHKDFAKRKSEKEKHNRKKSSISELENTDESLSEKEEEKEKRRLKREAEKQAVNNSNVLLLFKFCPRCRKQTLYKEVKNKRN